MTSDRPEQLVLDTNILVHLVRWDEVGQAVNEEFSLLMRKERAVLSYVSIAEIRVLGRRFNRGDEKLEYIGKLRSEMVVLPIEREPILERYVELDVVLRSDGETMGKNDIWIAATADALDATLVTVDQDFDHLHGEYFDVARFDLDDVRRIDLPT